jgi:hypothetical protein
VILGKERKGMAMNINKLPLDEQKRFYEFVTEYPCFSDGHLDLYAFSVYFANALWVDDIEPPAPHLIADLFLENIYATPNGKENAKELIINDMDESQRQIYPNGTSIALNISAVSYCIHDFVFKIGSRLLSFEVDKERPYFAYWLRSENVYTYALLNRLFAKIRRTITEIDDSGDLKAAIQDLNLAKGMDVSLSDNLMIKDDISNIAIDRISKAISENYYLEAITLQESIISDRLALFLHHQGKKSDSKTLNNLISSVQHHNKETLFEKIDLWRKKRNKAIHGLVRSSPFDIQIGLTAFDLQAKETAIEGEKLVIDTMRWFDAYVYENLNPFQIKPYDKYILTKKDR